ncbi:hypothetical protein C0995_001720 [Termitomyces sp. Mi166|nr:hypothetical protein C0995_001720 [Termitomyces sp. Mi166\
MVLGSALLHKAWEHLPLQDMAWHTVSSPSVWATQTQSKPHTFTSDQAWVAFAISYLQGIALDHYTAILCFNPDHPLFTNWQAFVNKFSFKFSVFDMVAEAERKLVSLRMRANKHFTVFVVQFKKEAYETSWNYNALRFQLSKALPKHIHNVLQLKPKQPTYKGFKNFITQID